MVIKPTSPGWPGLLRQGALFQLHHPSRREVTGLAFAAGLVMSLRVEDLTFSGLLAFSGLLVHCCRPLAAFYRGQFSAGYTTNTSGFAELSVRITVD